jgi:sugar (pentulose or hexulose) kinase
VIATGGASKNAEIVQCLSDVFNAPTNVVGSSASSGGNSACLGAAYRACYVVTAAAVDNNHPAAECRQSYIEFVESKSPALKLSAEPSGDAEYIYGPMLTRYGSLIDSLIPTNE